MIIPADVDINSFFPTMSLTKYANWGNKMPEKHPLSSKRDIIGGSTIQFATMAEVCALYPMDLVRSLCLWHFQCFFRWKHAYKQMAALTEEFLIVSVKFWSKSRQEVIFLKIKKLFKIFQGLFNGVAEPLLFETIKRATKCYTFEQCKHTLEPFIGGYQMHIWTVGIFEEIF